jgi:hypothetical protein
MKDARVLETVGKNGRRTVKYFGADRPPAESD